MQALTHASSEQTTLLVTHQLEGLADWDDVWVMQDGQIIEQGDYATLARAGGVFSALLAHRQEGDLNARTLPIWRSINAINGCCCLASCWPFVTLLAGIGLLTLSGWFLSASAVVGVAGIYSFNYMLPAAGVRVRGNYPYRRALL